MEKDRDRDNDKGSRGAKNRKRFVMLCADRVEKDRL